MTYARALREFNRSAANDISAVALRTAIERNRFVPGFLLGVTPLPKHDPELYSPGSIEEAILYASQAGDAWDAVPGALQWLRAGMADS